MKDIPIAVQFEYTAVSGCIRRILDALLQSEQLQEDLNQLNSGNQNRSNKTINSFVSKEKKT